MALSRGLLHGYRKEEDALQTLQGGRIVIERPLLRRLGGGLAVEVRYDEFADAILANRLVKAAAGRLGRMRPLVRPADVETAPEPGEVPSKTLHG